MNSASPAIRLRGLAATAMIGSDRSGGQASSPADVKPVAGSAAMATLMRLLGNPDAGLIEEWSQCARARGQRVAEPTVPMLLDWWCSQPQRKDVVFAVCGKCGEWLASLNPAWRKPVAGEDIPHNVDEIWQTGKAPERLSLLLTVRKFEPARALALVQSTWASDGADERRRFVEALADRLTMNDEPFLEAALDDKSKVVRRAAASVLGRLPASRFKSRLNALARSVIVVERKRGILKRSLKFSLEPPKEFDKSWERDGLEEQAASGMGQRAWWLQQILSAADLSVWTDTTELDPESVLEAIGEDDYFGNALEAMIEALRVQPNSAWVGAVLTRLLKGKKLDPQDLARLTHSLTPQESHPLLLDAAQHSRFGNAERWKVLALATHPWSLEFSRAALKVLSKTGSLKAEVWALYDSVERVSRLVSPELAEEFAEIVQKMFPDQLTDSFKKSIDRVRVRADIHKEFEQ